eukprot:7841312-Lingulodinium_polyedra.AAC.1
MLRSDLACSRDADFEASPPFTMGHPIPRKPLAYYKSRSRIRICRPARSPRQEIAAEHLQQYSP